MVLDASDSRRCSYSRSVSAVGLLYKLKLHPLLAEKPAGDFFWFDALRLVTMEGSAENHPKQATLQKAGDLIR